jgi:hypothetical protein
VPDQADYEQNQEEEKQNLRDPRHSHVNSRETHQRR